MATDTSPTITGFQIRIWDRSGLRDIPERRGGTNGTTRQRTLGRLHQDRSNTRARCARGISVGDEPHGMSIEEPGLLFRHSARLTPAVGQPSQPAFRSPSTMCSWSSGRIQGTRLWTYISKEPCTTAIAFSNAGLASSM